MRMTPLGITKLVKLVQLTNALSPILVMLLGSVTLGSLAQYSKAASPILVTLSGSVMLGRLVQWENAKLPMFLMLLPSVRLVRPEQELNALSPMLVTLLGIVTPLTPVLWLNAPSPMLVTGSPFVALGMITGLLGPVYPVMVRAPLLVMKVNWECTVAGSKSQSTRISNFATQTILMGCCFSNFLDPDRLASRLPSPHHFAPERFPRQWQVSADSCQTISLKQPSNCCPVLNGKVPWRFHRFCFLK